ncbi:hypothetical protein [Roseovarius indicus]|uniref:hypothetical protein n=1 Tax=Roseovarius indicus TaxID=540747 RepID=UPI0007DA07BA|nr:hypothetical protein [Roseovarius indicus]OAO05391.1 hypothetical protein A8B76_02815 [Roseovarius indicus]
MDQQQAYKQKYEAKLEEWQAEIDKLRAQAKGASADSQIDYEKQLDELRQRRDEMQAQVEKLKSSQGEAWTDMKAGAEKAWTEMSSAMEKARSRFK